MKKVLIVINQLNIGGVSKALIELVKAAADAYDISVLPLDPRGDYIKDLPKSVKVLKPLPSGIRCLTICFAALRARQCSIE